MATRLDKNAEREMGYEKEKCFGLVFVVCWLVLTEMMCKAGTIK